MKQKNVNRILAETPRIYDSIASDFSDTRGKWWEGFGDFAKYAKAGDKILDLGCGNGRMAQLFYGLGVSYLGLDNSKELIKIAQQRYRTEHDYSFQTADVLALNLAPDQFNLVLMIAVLHHAPTKELRLKVLKDIFAVLKPGGRLVLSNWNLWKISGRKSFRYYSHLFNFWEKIRQGSFGLKEAFVPWKANLPKSEWHARYIHSFTAGELQALLLQAGFTIDSLGYVSKSRGKASIFTGDNLLAVAVKKC